jgi:hypothetical protein
VTVSDETEERVLDKARYVEETVTILADKRELDEAAYLADREQRSIVEREFQTDRTWSSTSTRALFRARQCEHLSGNADYQDT